ncbi:sulfatase-like hydrolase/transferase [Neorhodopirellula pilleata]|uniref:Arylsulfatase n=1 Tax=Neorhodopirellula pilleata TaxID=2714738 RepID=A0A5C6A6G2_9BACT|nr:sulfatase-like hydrolase/transferase [Neorhodopirellula pilleata]TWT94868.1 Arylsulfatase [Neorhodopirellula pilleata]
MSIPPFIPTCLFVVAVGAMTNPHAPVHAATPNIVVVLCDDLGYGDVSCLNLERGKIATEAIDRLARDGMIFTDAHSGSSVCTPTRYGLLTGRYSWRTRLQRGVVEGFAPCLIAPDRPTIASFLRSQGYYTAIIGKWHLDFQYQDPATGELLSKADVQGKGKPNSKGIAPVGSRIPDGPIHRGFDYFHGFHHARDMKGVIENDEVILHDEEINMLPRLTRKAVEFIDERAKLARQKPDEPGQPFFLYVPFGSPHTPILPTKAWRGKSGLGDYAGLLKVWGCGGNAIAQV